MLNIKFEIKNKTKNLKVCQEYIKSQNFNVKTAFIILIEVDFSTIYG
jgi:hypothetical protein